MRERESKRDDTELFEEMLAENSPNLVKGKYL
jgi:hypothetical protein